MKLQPQIERLYQLLSTELENFPAGRKFYSVRDLSYRFGFNRRVVDGTLERLERENLIRREPYVGIFSNVNLKPLARKLLFAAPDFPSEVISLRSRLIAAHVERDPKYTLTKTFFDPLTSSLCQLPVDGADALIIIRRAGDLFHDELGFLAGLRIPVVFIDSVLGDVPFSTVCNDNEHGGMLAADCLIRHGHNRLLIVLSEPDCGEIRGRTRSFEAYARLRGASVYIVDCHTHNAESANQSAYQGVSSYLERHGCDFTGMFVVSDGSVPGVLTALRENHLSVPDDVSVIGFDGLASGEFCHPPLTSVGSDMSRLVERMFVELDRVFSKEQSCFRIRQPMRLIERDSVKAMSLKIDLTS